MMKKTLWHIFIPLFLSVLTANTFAEEELLAPDVAYAFSARVVDANTIEAEWNVADGYYLYRSKVRFSSDKPGIRLGEPELPKGKIKNDEFFGKVEIYRHKITARIPLIRDDASLNTFTLIAKSQGCADIGVCYPPHQQKVNLTLPAAATAAKAGSALAALDTLSSNLGLGGGGEEDILEPDQAFQFSTALADPNTVLARWTIAPDHYLYRDKFKFSLKNSAGVSLGQVQLPQGESKKDEFFGAIQVFHDQLEARIPLVRAKKDAVNITLHAEYQGCAEKTGICYPPIKKDIPFELPYASALIATKGDPKATPAGTANDALSEQDSIAASLASGNQLLTIITFFGFGLLLAFTPCVFPMIPILSSIIVGQGENITTRRAFIMSVVYVLAMALTYTVAGVVAGLVGENLQAAFQNPWILSSFATVFVLLSLSMFGFYDLQIPNFLQSKLTEVSNRQQGGTLIGVAVMGFLSALIVGPCVAAPLAGALIYIGQSGDAVLGGIALFALSLGMGAPLIALGASAGKLLPKAGAWMDAVKSIFGVMLLAVAIWMLERILPEAVSMMLWAVLFIVSAIYLKALDTLPADSTGWSKLWKGVGLVMLVYGVLLMIGVASGGRDMMQPLKGLTMGGAGMTSQQQHLNFRRIKSVADLERELAAATAQGKPVMLDFYADWCVYCKDYEKYVFPDPRVQNALANTVLLQADVTANDDEDKALLKKVRVTAPPAILFFDSQTGEERKRYRLVGKKNADEFLAHLQKALR